MAYQGSTGSLPGGGYSSGTGKVSAAYARGDSSLGKGYVGRGGMKPVDYSSLRKMNRPQEYDTFSFMPFYEDWLKKYRREQEKMLKAMKYSFDGNIQRYRMN